MSEEGEGAGEGTGEGVAADAWRQDWAGEDTEKLEHIGRYATVNDALNGGYSAKLKIASGDYKQDVAFPTEGTDEAKAEWRTARGIPQDGKYELGEFEGDMKTSMDSLTERAFENNLTPETAKIAATWFMEEQTAAEERQFTADDTARETTEDTLRTEWGNEYRTNMSKVQGLLDSAPEGLKEDILGARLASGVPLGSDPAALKFLVDIALIKNPTTTLVPQGGDLNSAIADELEQIKSIMHKKEEYTEAKQARYRELLIAQSQ